MDLSGLAGMALTIGLIALIWLGGAVLIKAGDLLERRRAAARRDTWPARKRALRRPAHQLVRKGADRS